MRVARLACVLSGLQLALASCVGNGFAPHLQFAAAVPGHAAAGVRPAADSAACASGAAATDGDASHRAAANSKELFVPRWPEEANPIVTVRIQDAPKLAGWTTGDRQEVISALSAWEGAGSPIGFSVVTGDDNPDAQVTVHWIEKFDSRYEGWTTVSWNHQGWLVSGDVTLALHSPAGQLLTSGEREQVAMHEIGHVLGLSHSRSVTSIMLPTVKVTRIGAEDVSALKALYERPDSSEYSLSMRQRAGPSIDRCAAQRI